jgi:hypothetical protein
MKYAVCLASFIVLCITVSCNKSDDDDTPAAGKTWKLGTTTYTVNNYAKANEDFQAYDIAGNGMIFSFKTFPTVEGNYNVVNGWSMLGPNDVSVVAFGSSSGTSYFSTGYDHTVANVKILSPTRLAITLPETWVLKSGSDSLKLSANIGSL